LAINISCYVQQIQLLTGLALNQSEKELHRIDQLSEDARFNILVKGAVKLAKALEEEIYREVKQKEGKSYDHCSNEMNMLALSTILACWSGWVFKSKSEDKKRATESREQASAVSKYIESLIRNAINAGQKMGEGGETPEGKSRLIAID
jgi:hypothetical protein